jgi:aminoglycoside phosphotransferase (APT) family kinase protein
MAGPRKPACDSAVRRLLARHLPGDPAERVRPLGGGLDNTAWDVDDRLVVRCSREEDPAARARRVEAEAGLLAAVAPLVPLSVACPVAVDASAGCLILPKLPGTSLLDVPRTRRERLAGALAPQLGAFLQALHGAPVAALPPSVPRDDFAPSGWLDEARTTFAALRGAVPAEHHDVIAAFLEQPAPPLPEDLTPTHGDLGAEHVLVDLPGGRITGIIDWGDAAIADPALDHGRLLRDLGPAVLDALHRDDPGLRRRAGFYARCTALEDLAFGLDSGRETYRRNALEAIRLLFPP